MMQRYPLRFCAGAVVFCLILAVCAGVSNAGTTGKLTGRVLDQSGAPLPGANVVLVGTNRGATTDADGAYFVLSVDPGTYAVEASMVGYAKQRKTGTAVQADYTTTVDFMLAEATLEAAEMVVVAERPPVEPDKTVSKYVVSAEEMALTPMVRTVENIVELQGGVSLDGEMSVRGGDTDDSAYYVDGVRISYRDSRGGGGTFRSVNSSAVRELTVLTGGMAAEYGNAQAGIVSMVTRDGGQRFDGRVEYLYTPAGKKHWGRNVFDNQALHKGHLNWDDPEWANETYLDWGPDGVLGTQDDIQRPLHMRQDYTEVAGHLVEANVSGPIMRNLTFFLSSRYANQAVPLPSASSTGQIRKESLDEIGSVFTQTPYNTQNTFKLTYRPNPNMTIRMGGLYNKSKYWNRGSGIIADIKGVGDGARNIFLPEEYSASGKQISTDDMEYLSVTHTVSPKTFYELRIYHSGSEIDTTGVPTVSTDIRKDTEGWYNLPRQILWYDLESRDRYGLKFDLSNQRTKGHFLKAGFELSMQKVLTLEVAEPTVSERRISFTGVNWWDEPYSAMNFSFYVQDKMEFEGLIVNAGLRYDRMWMREKVPMWRQYGATPMYYTFLRSRDIPKESMSAKQALAPRIGISHPITDRSAFHFTWGKYYQLPIIWSLLAQEWGTNQGDADWNGDGQIGAAERYNTYGSVRGAAVVAGARLVHGNSNLKAEVTTSFEVGVDWNFALDYIFGLTTYYRSVKEKPGNGASGSWNWSDPSGISQTQPTETWERRGYEDVKGFEMAFRKPFSHNFSFRLAYNVQWASAGRAEPGWSNPMPDSMFVANGYYWNSWTIGADGSEIPETLQNRAIREGLDPDYYIMEYGHTAAQNIRNWEEGRRDAGYEFWVNDGLSDPEKGLWIYNHSATGYHGGNAMGRDRRYYGSLSVLFSSPQEFGPRLRGWYPLGNIRMNMVYKIQTGTPYLYSPPDGAQEWRFRPISTVTDFSMEKSFPRMKPVQPTLFLEVDNLFNQKDNSDVGPNRQEYIQWGLNIPKPDDPDYMQWGDANDMGRYVGRPREVRMGIRLFF